VALSALRQPLHQSGHATGCEDASFLRDPHAPRTQHRTYYRTPINVFQRGNEYFFFLTYGSDVQWVKNVLAAGSCSIETRGRVVELVEPESLSTDRPGTGPRRRSRSRRSPGYSISSGAPSGSSSSARGNRERPRACSRCWLGRLTCPHAARRARGGSRTAANVLEMLDRPVGFKTLSCRQILRFAAGSFYEPYARLEDVSMLSRCPFPDVGPL
jgi:hypothetical protein